MTDEKLAAIESRVQAATPGPWSTHTESYGAHHGREWEVSTEEGHGIWTAHTQSAKDAQFIAHARADVPALLSHVAEMRRLLVDFLNGDSFYIVAAFRDGLADDVRRVLGESTHGEEG